MGVKQNLDPTLARPIKQFQLVGRAAPTQKTPVPKIYRIKVFAASKVLAKSKFWYFMKKVCKAKKTGGEMLAINEIFEKNPNAVKNYGIWLLPQPHGPAQHVQGVPRLDHQRRGVADVRGDVWSPPCARRVGHDHEDGGHPGGQGAP